MNGEPDESGTVGDEFDLIGRQAIIGEKPPPAIPIRTHGKTHLTSIRSIEQCGNLWAMAFFAVKPAGDDVKAVLDWDGGWGRNTNFRIGTGLAVGEFGNVFSPELLLSRALELGIRIGRFNLPFCQILKID